jgi:hypothetical protein
MIYLNRGPKAFSYSLPFFPFSFMRRFLYSISLLLFSPHLTELRLDSRVCYMWFFSFIDQECSSLLLQFSFLIHSLSLLHFLFLVAPKTLCKSAILSRFVGHRLWPWNVLAWGNDRQGTVPSPVHLLII